MPAQTNKTSLLRQRLLFSLLLLVTSCYAYTPTPPIMGLGALLFQPSGIKTRPCLGENSDIREAADFFTDAFWTAKIGGAKTLSEKQRKSLYTSQLQEFKRRYGIKMSDRSAQDRRAEMLLCEDSRGELMGVAAVEVEKIPSSGLNSRSSQRAPLMSNVAVSKKFRRRGIAEVMVKDIESMVRLQWGYDDVFLYVEQRNKPAIRLYQKLGYKKYWTDNTAKTLVPTTNGSMQNEPTTLVCMRKRLNGNVFTRFFSR